MNRRAKALPTSTRLGLAFIVGVALFGLIVPLLPTSDAYSQMLAFRLQPPMSIDPTGIMHPLGTDPLGRDLLSRLALAGRLSLLLALAAVLIALVVGASLGLVAGYLGGFADTAISTLVDIQLSVPRFVILIAVVALFGSSLTNLALTLGLTGWVVYARVVRTETLSLREREFVEAARSVGVSTFRMLFRQLLPNELPTLLVLASFDLGQVIILEAGLSFLGLGIQAPLPAWGSMISGAQDYLHSTPLLTLLPGIAIFLVVAGVNLISQRFTFEERAGPTNT